MSNEKNYQKLFYGYYILHLIAPYGLALNWCTSRAAEQTLDCRRLRGKPAELNEATGNKVPEGLNFNNP